MSMPTLSQLELPDHQRHWVGPELLVRPPSDVIYGILVMPGVTVADQIKTFWDVLLTYPDTTAVAFVRPFSSDPPSFKPLI